MFMFNCDFISRFRNLDADSFLCTPLLLHDCVEFIDINPLKIFVCVKQYLIYKHQKYLHFLTTQKMHVFIRGIEKVLIHRADKYHAATWWTV